MTQLWRDHSLSIVLVLSGAGFCVLAWMLEPGKVFDTLLTLGGGLLTVAVFYIAAGSLREKNKPED